MHSYVFVIRLQLVGGQPEYSAISNGKSSGLLADVKVHDGKWHNVTLILSENRETLSIDGSTFTMEEPYDPTPLSTSDMALGGIPSSVPVQKKLPGKF